MTKEKRKVLIIGGGVSGLATGIYLLKSGYDVEILEKNAMIGGACVGWMREGCYIDGCIHWLVGTNSRTPFYKIWRETHAIENDTEIYFQNEFSVYEFPDGEKLTVWADYKQFEEELLRIAPEDEKEIRGFIRLLKRYSRINGPVDKPIDMMSMVQLLGLGVKMGGDLLRVMKDSSVSCESYAKRFKNKYLRQFFSTYMAPQYNLMSMLFMLGHVMNKDGGIPIGGSMELSNRMFRFYLSKGGKIRFKSEVDSVIIDKNVARGVVLVNREHLYADWIVSSVPAEHCLKKLLKNKYRLPKMEERYANMNVYPIYTMTIAVFKTSADTSNVPLSSHVITDNKLYLDTFYGGVSLRNYGYDKTLKTDGNSQVLQAHLTGGDGMYFWWKSKRSQGEYKKEKERVAREMEEVITNRYPELKGKLQLIDVVTPLTYERYLNTRHGSFQGFVHTAKGKSLMQSGVIEGLNNFILSGQCIFQSGGLPVAAMVGKFAAERICRTDRVRFVARDYTRLKKFLYEKRKKEGRHILTNN